MTESGESEWMAAMRAGDFARAWEINARDLRDLVAQGRPKHEGPRHLQRIWRGEPLAGSRELVR
jgi:ketosteroid isomerase-like protein